ncbi:hypothetical protein J6590_071680 [Homalodisca vitripennis]|nr:hypothetical protein J6590_071680 [Homalodisca vitripennis]
MAPIVSHLTSSATVITAVHTVHSIRRLFVCCLLGRTHWLRHNCRRQITETKSRQELDELCHRYNCRPHSPQYQTSQKRNHGRNLTSSATVITAVHSIRRLFVCWTGLIGFVTIADDRSQKRNHGRNLMSSATVITAVHTVHSIRRLFVCLFAVCWTGLIGFVTIADDRSQKRNHGRNLTSSATVITAVHSPQYQTFVYLFVCCLLDRTHWLRHNCRRQITEAKSRQELDELCHRYNCRPHSSQYQTFVCLFVCWTGLIGFVTIADDRSQKRNHGRNLTSSATVITAVHTVHSIRRLFVCCLLDRTHWLRHNCRHRPQNCRNLERSDTILLLTKARHN